jgi:HD-like signal output (HDOD) protein
MPYTIEYVSQQLQENMPSLSPTALKVIQLANTISTPPGELTRVIKLDPVLSAKVLKLVNSSYFSLSSQIVSLEKAVILLGLNTIKNLALSAAVLAQMEAMERRGDFDEEAFWKHSLAVGVTAKLIAQKRGVEKKTIEDYFISGLLHDLGLLAELKVFPEEAKNILLAIADVSLYDAEDIILGGLTHCTIGQVLARHWLLPEGLCNVLLRHHNPWEESDPSELAVTVYLANIICKKNGVGIVMGKPEQEADLRAYAVLGVKASIEAEILEVIETEITKAMEFLKA